MPRSSRFSTAILTASGGSPHRLPYEESDQDVLLSLYGVADPTVRHLHTASRGTAWEPHS